MSKWCYAKVVLSEVVLPEVVLPEVAVRVSENTIGSDCQHVVRSRLTILSSGSMLKKYKGALPLPLKQETLDTRSSPFICLLKLPALFEQQQTSNLLIISFLDAEFDPKSDTSRSSYVYIVLLCNHTYLLWRHL